MIDNSLIGAMCQTTIAQRRKAFLCIPADARIRECRLGSSASVEATLPVIVADVTLALAVFDFDFRVKSSDGKMFPSTSLRP